MANTGPTWSAWDYAEVSSVDVNDTDLNDETTLTTDEIDLDGKALIEIGIDWVEGNDGAVDGDLNVYILRDLGERYEAVADDPFSFIIDVVQNASRSRAITLEGIKTCKVLVDNDSGQDGDLTIMYRTADYPAAS